MDTTQIKLTRQINELKQLIETDINNCDVTYTPTICQMKDTPEGKKQLAETILKRCMETGVTVQTAINDIEKEYNPNHILN